MAAQNTAKSSIAYNITAAELVRQYTRSNGFPDNSGCSWVLPGTELLNPPEQASEIQRREYAEWLYGLFREHLSAYGIKATVKDYTYNDYAVIFRVQMHPGETSDKLLRMRQDFEMRLGCPVEVMLSDDGYIVLAAKSLTRPVYPIRRLLESQAFAESSGEVPIAMGVNLMGGDYLIDLAQIQNLLVVGTTGSGKSTFITSLILSLLYRFSPQELQLVLIDPKTVDLQPYSRIPHAVLGVASRTEDALGAICWALAEAQARMELVKAARCMSFEEYNARMANKLSRVVVVIDEYSELMLQAGKELENLVRQLASRTATSGVHLILSTQRPSPDVVSPSIKAIIPCRASFTVVDKRESRMAVFRTGAERLMGLGDMIYSRRSEDDAVHIQAAFVSPEEADRVIAAVSAQSSPPAPHLLTVPELLSPENS